MNPPLASAFVPGQLYDPTLIEGLACRVALFVLGRERLHLLAFRDGSFAIAGKIVILQTGGCGIPLAELESARPGPVLRRRFWRDLNDTLEQPLLRNTKDIAALEPRRHELPPRAWSELRQLLVAALHLFEPRAETSTLVFRKGTPLEPPAVDRILLVEENQTARAILNELLAQVPPVGWGLNLVGQPRFLRSSYRPVTGYKGLMADAPSAHERLEAVQLLTDYFQRKGSARGLALLAAL